MTSASIVTVLRFPAPSTGFDPAICASSQQPCGVSPTSETIQAIHEAFQTLCEENTARFDRDFARANAAAGLSTEDLTQCSASSRRFSSDIEPVTVFHSKTLAKLSLYELGKIMMRSVGCLEEMLAVTVVLCARYCLSADVKPTKHIMHRLYVACMQLALKAHCDHYYRNSHFAYLAGISASELNRQEAELLRGMDWSVQVTGHELESVANCVMADLRAFTKPVQRFSGASTDRNYLAMSSNSALSQSNIDLVSLAAMPTLAESCPMKIGAVLRNAQRPLGGQEHQLDSSPFRREGSGWSRARVLQEVHEKQLIDSPHSAAGSGSDDDA